MDRRSHRQAVRLQHTPEAGAVQHAAAARRQQTRRRESRSHRSNRNHRKVSRMSVLLTETVGAARIRPHTSRIAAYVELTKPGITSFIMLSAATGYLLAPGPARGAFVFFAAILG